MVWVNSPALTFAKYIPVFNNTLSIAILLLSTLYVAIDFPKTSKIVILSILFSEEKFQLKDWDFLYL